MTMNFSPEQDKALEAVQQWFDNCDGERFRLDGYAGTGKTTLAKYFASMVSGRVCFGAFTGKAASVLRKKGCPNATTIHSLIYKPNGKDNETKIDELQKLIEGERDKPHPDGTLVATWTRELTELEKKSKARFVLQAEPEIVGAALVIIDESSMLDMQMVRDLESFGVPILYLGDPGQLPPVGGKPFLTETRADFTLTEIHRQAADSEVLRLATHLRRGGRPRVGDFGDVQIIEKASLSWDALALASQVICGKNDTRRRINIKLRKLRGIDNVYPVSGDKLICTRNNHDIGLLNGVTCHAASDATWADAKTIGMDVNYEGEEYSLIVSPKPFQQTYGKPETFVPVNQTDHFDYGYCITGHKSQGSQWTDIVVCDDAMQVNDPDFRAKWLYTVVTRAEKKVTMYV